MTNCDLQCGADRFITEKADILNALPHQTLSGTITGDGQMDNTRENNHNWRGGRVTTQHGYILVRVGVGHPMADCRGYAYEHRIVLSNFAKVPPQPQRQFTVGFGSWGFLSLLVAVRCL